MQHVTRPRLSVSGNRDRLIVVCLGASSVLVNLALLARFGIGHGGDTSRYLDGATDLMAGRLLPLDRATFLGYIGVVAAVRALGAGQAGVIGVQVAVAALAALALFDLGRQLSGRPAGLLAAGLFIVNVDIARWHTYVLTDSLYISLAILATWFVHRAVGRGIGAHLGAAFVVLLAALVRPNGWIFVPIAAIYWISRTSCTRLTKWAAAGGVLLVCAGGALFLREIRGTSRVADSQNAHGTPPVEWLSWTRYGNGVHQPESIQLAATRVVVELVHVRSFYSSRHNTVVVGVLAITYPLAILGFGRGRNHPLARLMAAVIAGHLLIVAATFADWDGRYLLYMFSLIVVFAACGALAIRGGLPLQSSREPVQGFSMASTRRSP